MESNEIVRSLRIEAQYQHNRFSRFMLASELSTAADCIESLQAQLAESQINERGISSRWRPVSEQPPEENTEYLCLCTGGCRVASYKLGQWKVLSNEQYSVLWTITHWQPLPPDLTEQTDQSYHVDSAVKGACEKDERYELIDRKALLKNIVTNYPIFIARDFDPINKAPAVDATPVVHGQWITTPFYGLHHEPIIECSVCHDQVEELKKRSAMKYCLTCGAKMGLEE